jgi:hypothetical protein
MRRVIAVFGLLVCALVLGAGSALAYQSGSGASVTTCDSRVPPGGSTCVQATFTTNGQPNVGDSVSYSSDRGGGNGCTVTFSPASGVTDQNGQANTTATFGTACRGNVQVCAADDSTGQSACATVIVNNGNGNGGNGGGGGGNGNGGGAHGNGGGHGQSQSSVQAASSGGPGTGSSGQASGGSGGSPSGSPAGGSPVAAIVGGSVAGLLVLAGFAAALLLRRRRTPVEAPAA